jgi:hypothetical protein
MTLGFSELTKRVYIQHGKEKKDVTEQFRAIESKEISLLQEQLRLSEENNKVLLEKLKGMIPKEKVNNLLEKQRELTAHSLGYSSAVYIYPQDYMRMEAWMLNCPLVEIDPTPPSI